MGILWRTESIIFLILLAAYKSAVFSRNFDDDNDVVRLNNVRSYNKVYHAEVTPSRTEVESVDIEELRTLVTRLFGALGAQNEVEMAQVLLNSQHNHTISFSPKARSNAKVDFEISMFEQDNALRTSNNIELESACREDMHMLAEETEFVFRAIREVRLATVNAEKSAWGKELVTKALTELASRNKNNGNNYKSSSDGSSNTIDSSNSLQLLKLLPPLPPFPPANTPAWRLAAWRLSRARHEAASEHLRLNASRAEAAHEVGELHREVVNMYDKKEVVRVQRSLLQKEEGVQAKAIDTVAGTSTLVASSATLDNQQEYSKRKMAAQRYSHSQKKENQAQAQSLSSLRSTEENSLTNNSALGFIAKLEAEVAALLERKRTIAQEAKERNKRQQEQGQRQQLQAPSPWFESSSLPRNNVVRFMVAEKWAMVVGGGWGWGGGWFGGDPVVDLDNLLLAYQHGVDFDRHKQEATGSSSSSGGSNRKEALIFWGGNGLAADVLATIIVLAAVLLFYLFLEKIEQYQLYISLSAQPPPARSGYNSSFLSALPPLVLTTISSSLSLLLEPNERIATPPATQSTTTTSPRKDIEKEQEGIITAVVMANSNNPDRVTGAARSIRCPNNASLTYSSSISCPKRTDGAPSNISLQTSSLVMFLKLFTAGASPRALMGVCCILAAFSLLKGGDPLLSMTPLTTEFTGSIPVEEYSGRQQSKEISDKLFKLQNITSKSGGGGETYSPELTQWPPETIAAPILLLPSSSRLAPSLWALWEAASFCDHGRRGYDSSSSSNIGSKTMKNRHGDNNNNGTTKESNKIRAGDYHDQNGGGESTNHGAADRGAEGIIGNKWWKCYFSRRIRRRRCLLAYPGVRRSLRAQVVFLVGFYGAASAFLVVAVFLFKAAKLASSSSPSSVNIIDGNNYIGGGVVGVGGEGGTNGDGCDNHKHRNAVAVLSSTSMSPLSPALFSSITYPAVTASRGLLLVSWCRSLRPARLVHFGLLFVVVSAGVLYLIFPDNTGIYGALWSGEEKQHVTLRSSFSGDVGSVIKGGDGNGDRGSVKHSPQGGGSGSSSGWWFWWNDGVVPCVCYLFLASSIATSTMLTTSYSTTLEVLLAPPPPPLTPPSLRMHHTPKSYSGSDQSRGREFKRMITGYTPESNSAGKSKQSLLPKPSPQLSVSQPSRESNKLNRFNAEWTTTDAAIYGDEDHRADFQEKNQSLVEDDEISRAVLNEDDEEGFDENDDTQSRRNDVSSDDKNRELFLSTNSRSSADDYFVTSVVGSDEFSSTMRNKRSSSADDAEVVSTRNFGVAKSQQFRHSDRDSNYAVSYGRGADDAVNIHPTSSDGVLDSEMCHLKDETVVANEKGFSRMKSDGSIEEYFLLNPNTSNTT